MKTIKIIIISLLVGLNLTSCDFLEKDPTYTTPENFFKNEADATSWLTGTYAILGQSSFYGNEFLYLVGGDDLGHYGGANRGPNKSGLICNNANTSDPVLQHCGTHYTPASTEPIFSWKILMQCPI